MPHYYFHLRDGTGGISDLEGIELPDERAARDHAAAVAGELMHQVEVKTRHWRLDVSDREGNLLFDLPFVQVDQTICHLPAQTRRLVERLCVHTRELGETIHQAKVTVLQSRALRARARGRPYLVTDRCGQLVANPASVRRWMAR